MPRVSVVIPIFNGIAHLSAFVESLGGALLPGWEVIAVDDASTEPVLHAFSALSDSTTVVRLRNEQNLGYAGAVNRGVAEATGDIIVQLNTDLVLDSGCITAMVDLIDGTKNVGIVGSKLIYPTTGRTQSVGMAFGNYSKRHIYRHLPSDHPVCQRTRRLQIVSGATVATTRRVFDLLGPLDEDLYNHNVDLDHCMRAVEQGLQNFMCAESVAYHWRNQSGDIRYARAASVEAAFWSKWVGKYEVDLGQYIDEAFDALLGAKPELHATPFTLLDLTRSADQSIALDRLEALWPGISKGARSHRQMHNAASHLWLPMLLPARVAADPNPFIYLVDSFQDLSENAMWFRRRRGLVVEELIVDLSANVQCASELFCSV